MADETKKPPEKAPDPVQGAESGHAGEKPKPAATLESGLTAPSPAALTTQREVFSPTKVSSSTADLVSQDKLPDCKIQKQDTPAEQAERQDMIPVLQQRLLSRLAVITAPPTPKDGEKGEQSQAAFLQSLKQRYDAIHGEMSDGTHPAVWGPATQAAFSDYLKYVEKQAPKAIVGLSAAGLPLAPGSPIEMPAQSGQPMTVNQYINKVASGDLTANLKVDTCQPPTVAQVQKIYDAENWSRRADLSMSDAQNQRFDQDISQYIDSHGLPKSWQWHEGEDREVWRAAVGTLVGLVDRVGYSLEVVNKLNLPVPPPPGASVTSGDNGRLNIKLDIPDDSRLSDPSNLAKIDRLVKWSDDAKTKIDQAMKADRAEVQQQFAWGDTPVPNATDPDNPDKSARAMARLDKDGRLVGLINPFDKQAKPLQNGETSVPINQLMQRLSAHADSNGDIVVSQTTQAQDAPPYAWYWPSAFSKDVGQPAQITDQHFKPDDVVKVTTPGGGEYMLARDLPSFADTAALKYNGENALSAAMDVSFLVPGLGELSMAGKAGYAAAKGADVALSTIAKVGGRGAFDSALGLSGSLGASSYWQETEGRRDLANWRGRIFLAGAARSLVEATKLTDGILGDSSKVDLTQFSNAAERTATSVAQKTLFAAQFPMGASLSDQIMHNLRAVVHPADPNADLQADEAYAHLQQLRPGNLPKESSGDQAASSDRDKLAQSIAEYQHLFAAGMSNTAGGADPQVDKIFTRLRQIVAAPDGAEDKEKLKAFETELVHNVVPFTPNQLATLQSLQGTPLTSEQVLGFTRPETPADPFAAQTYESARYMLSGKSDNDRAAASAVALMILSHMQGGQDASKGAASVTAPLEVGEVSYLAAIPSRDRNHLNVTLSPADIEASLKNSLAKSESDGRGIAMSDVLGRFGAISVAENGAVLQNVLNNPKATSFEKLSALNGPLGPRLGAIAAGLRRSEEEANNNSGLSPDQRAAARAAHFGTSAADLEQTLAHTAADDSNPDVRAVSAATLYSLKRMDTDRREGVAALDMVAKAAQQNMSGHYPSLAADATNALLAQLSNGSSVDVQRRIDAGGTLLDLAQHAQPDTAAKIQSAVASSFAEAFQKGTDRQAVDVLHAMSPDVIARLAKDNPQALQTLQSEAVARLSNPQSYDSEQERDSMAIMSKMPDIMAGADPSVKESFYKQARTLLLNSLPQYNDLRAATLDAITRSGLTEAVTDGTLSKVAAGDPAASTRLAALQAMERLDPQTLSKIVPQRLAEERDPSVRRLLEQLNDGQNQRSTSASIEQVLGSIDKRYPQVSQFDATAQSQWIKQNAPLLDPATFISNVQRATKGKETNWMWAADRAGNSVADQRYAQFQNILAQAQGDITDVKTQQARELLFSIATGKREVAPQSPEILIGHSSLPQPVGESIPGPSLEVDDYYHDRGANWSEEAARALAETARIGGSGRDFTAGLVYSALGAGVQGQTRQILLKAWTDLSSPFYGLTALPKTSNFYDLKAEKI